MESGLPAVTVQTAETSALLFRKLHPSVTVQLCLFNPACLPSAAWTPERGAIKIVYSSP